MFYNTLVPFTCAPCSRVPRLQSWRLTQITKLKLRHLYGTFAYWL